MSHAPSPSRWTAIALAILVTPLALPVHAATVATPQKLDATLSAVAGGGGITRKLLQIDPAGGQSMVETILRFEGDLDAVKAQGAVVRSVMGSIATVNIPADKLAAVAALPSVISIEASHAQPLRLDKSVAAARADTLRTGTPPTWSGGTGKNVIVGIIDSGLDFKHNDFRNGDGTTRVLAIWDQRPDGASGSPPPGYTYGGVCTSAMSGIL